MSYYYNKLDTKAMRLYDRLLSLIRNEVRPDAECVYNFPVGAIGDEETLIKVLDSILLDHPDLPVSPLVSDFSYQIKNGIFHLEISTSSLKHTNFDQINEIIDYIRERVPDWDIRTSEAICCYAAYLASHGFIYYLYRENEDDQRVYRLSTLTNKRFGCCNALALLSKVVFDRLGFDCICVPCVLPGFQSAFGTDMPHLINAIRVGEEYLYFDATSFVPSANASRKLMRELQSGWVRDRYATQLPVGYLHTGEYIKKHNLYKLTEDPNA